MSELPETFWKHTEAPFDDMFTSEKSSKEALEFWLLHGASTKEYDKAHVGYSVDDIFRGKHAVIKWKRVPAPDTELGVVFETEAESKYFFGIVRVEDEYFDKVGSQMFEATAKVDAKAL